DCVLAIADFPCGFAGSRSETKGKDCFGETPKPARETRALPDPCGVAAGGSRDLRTRRVRLRSRYFLAPKFCCYKAVGPSAPEFDRPISGGGRCEKCRLHPVSQRRGADAPGHAC